MGDGGGGVGDAVAYGGLEGPTALDRHERGAEQRVAGSDRVDDVDRRRRHELVDRIGSASDAVTAGRHHRRPGAGGHQRRGRCPRPRGDVGGGEVVEVDRLAAAVGRRALARREGLLGFGEVGAEEVGARRGRLDQPGAGDVDRERRHRAREPAR